MEKRRFADTFLLAASGITVALTVVQFALAGLGTFTQVHNKRTGDSDFAAHQTVGFVIALLAVLVLVAALIARQSRRSVIMAVALFVVAAPVQPVLGTLGADQAAWVGMLHALGGLAILGLAGNVLGQAVGRRRAA